jgi:hypothetical protein
MERPASPIATVDHANEVIRCARALAPPRPWSSGERCSYWSERVSSSDHAGLVAGTA